MASISQSFRGFLYATALAIGLSSYGQAAECTLKLQSTFDLKREPDGRFLVPVTLEDHPLKLMLDTGDALSSILTQATVDTLHLDSFAIQTKIIDAEGHVLDRGVEAKNFRLDHIKLDHLYFWVSPWMRFGDPEAAGLLGPDILHVFDVDLDPAANKLKLFSQDHCPGQVVYWTRDWVVSSIHVSRGGHILIKVELDGKTVDAWIDTGAARTILSASAAKDLFGLDANSPGALPVGESNDPTSAHVFRYNFQNLSLSGIVVNNPHIVIIPDKMEAAQPKHVVGTLLAPSGDSDTHMPAIIIGMNILSKLHIYIAYGEEKFYASAAGAHN